MDSADIEKLLPRSGLFGAVRFIITYGLDDVMKYVSTSRQDEPKSKQLLSRPVASSFPSVVSLLRRLLSQPLDVEVLSTLTTYKKEDLKALFQSTGSSISMENFILFFQSGIFSRSLICAIGFTAIDLWSNRNLAHVPGHILNPLLCMSCEALSTLENIVEKDEPVKVRFFIIPA